MQRRKTAALALSLLVGFTGLGAKCTPGPKPSVSVTLHAISDDLNDLLVIPTDALIPVNATFTPDGSPIDPESFTIEAHSWSGDPSVFGTVVSADATTGLATFPPFSLTPGSWSIVATISDGSGESGKAPLSIAVRDRPGSAPIGADQNIWYDFTSDRDAVPGPDFPLDLEAFGLGSPLDPVLSAQIEADVIGLILDRVMGIYYDPDPNGFGVPDPVAVSFFSSDPGTGDVTRICVGGEDPSGGSVVGSILIDMNNGNRTSVECGTLPPTGIFPRELLFYQTQAPFQASFDPPAPADQTHRALPSERN